MPSSPNSTSGDMQIVEVRVIVLQSRARAASVRAILNQQIQVNIQLTGEVWARMATAIAHIKAAEQGIVAAGFALAGVR